MAATALTACDIPTSAPSWDTRWVVPADSISLSVDSLLPASVRTTTAAGAGAFQLSLPDVTFDRTLEQICPACAALDGFTAPAPAFTTSFSGTVLLPAEVISARVLDGSVVVTLTNTLGFDPLRPSAGGARGTVTITARSGSTTLATATIDGATTALPSGTSVTRTLSIAAGTVSGPIVVVVDVVSPQGDPAAINSAGGISVVARPVAVRLGEARIALANQRFAAADDTIDLSGLDSAVTERVQSGALRLHVSNPFQVRGTFAITIRTATTTITKPLTVAEGESDVRVEFTRAEIQSIAGQEVVRVGASGIVSTPTGSATFRPGQALTLRGSLEVVVRTPEA